MINIILFRAFIEHMRIINLLILTIFVYGCSASDSQRLEVVEFDELSELMASDSGKIEVINFWATWCKPCITEIPYFQAIHNSDERVNVTLVSLDFADEFQSKVIPFVEKNGLTADILLLDDLDYNSWIDKVDPTWSGAIPATLVINHKNGKRKFIEKELEEGEIESIIEGLTD